jgi:hypothetical protein
MAPRRPWTGHWIDRGECQPVPSKAAAAAVVLYVVAVAVVEASSWRSR